MTMAMKLEQMRQAMPAAMDSRRRLEGARQNHRSNSNSSKRPRRPR